MSGPLDRTGRPRKYIYLCFCTFFSVFDVVELVRLSYQRGISVPFFPLFNAFVWCMR
jgi:hypothetical protein